MSRALPNSIIPNRKQATAVNGHPATIELEGLSQYHKANGSGTAPRVQGHQDQYETLQEGILAGSEGHSSRRGGDGRSTGGELETLQLPEERGVTMVECPICRKQLSSSRENDFGGTLHTALSDGNFLIQFFMQTFLTHVNFLSQTEANSLQDQLLIINYCQQHSGCKKNDIKKFFQVVVLCFSLFIAILSVLFGRRRVEGRGRLVTGLVLRPLLSQPVMALRS